MFARLLLRLWGSGVFAVRRGGPRAGQAQLTGASDDGDLASQHVAGDFSSGSAICNSGGVSFAHVGGEEMCGWDGALCGRSSLRDECVGTKRVGEEEDEYVQEECSSS
jgi:hypothetical protein